MKNFYESIFLITLFLTTLYPAHASVASEGDSTRSRRWYVPHYIPLQFAGNIGLLSTGAGYGSRQGTYYIDVLYGYVPRSLAGHYIHTIALKNYFSAGHITLSSGQSLMPYLGLGVSLEVGGSAFFLQPSHFPDSYYDFPKNLHALLYAGVRIRHLFVDHPGWLRGIELFAEANTIDVYLWYKSMSKEINIGEVFSVSCGVNVLLWR